MAGLVLSLFFPVNIWVLDSARLNVLKTGTQLHMDRLQGVVGNTSVNKNGRNCFFYYDRVSQCQGQHYYTGWKER